MLYLTIDSIRAKGMSAKYHSWLHSSLLPVAVIYKRFVVLSAGISRHMSVLWLEKHPV